MRGYRLFNDISSVAVEWRIAGFRIRTLHALWVFIAGVAAVSLFLINTWLAIAGIVFVAATAFLFAVYIYRVDRNLVLSEITLLSLLWSGTRHRYVTNETKED